MGSCRNTIPQTQQHKGYWHYTIVLRYKQGTGHSLARYFFFVFLSQGCLIQAGTYIPDLTAQSNGLYYPLSNFLCGNNKRYMHNSIIVDACKYLKHCQHYHGLNIYAIWENFKSCDSHISLIHSRYNIP